MSEAKLQIFLKYKAGDLSFEDVVNGELASAIHNFPPMNSAHEGFAILKEEVDELWDEVKTNQKDRGEANMFWELVQVAAMAQRMAIDVIFRGRIRK